MKTKKPKPKKKNPTQEDVMKFGIDYGKLIFDFRDKFGDKNLIRLLQANIKSEAEMLYRFALEMEKK